jgi:hypothetical protein
MRFMKVVYGLRRVSAKEDDKPSTWGMMFRSNIPVSLVEEIIIEYIKRNHPGWEFVPDSMHIRQYNQRIEEHNKIAQTIFLTNEERESFKSKWKR